MIAELQQPKELRILNLGAGVQSTTLALMAGTVPEVPLFDYAIFADTGEEPQAVYDHLAWLIKQLRYPVLIQSKGKLGDDLKNGRITSKGERFASIPAFVKTPSANGGLTSRHCTKDYKTDVVERVIRREILGLEPRARMPVGVAVHQYLGLSYDELGRIARVRAVFADKQKWSVPHFPLFEMEMTRRKCLEWLKTRVPHQVPRSACVFCPFKSNAEWRRTRDQDPVGWARSIEIDHMLRDSGSRVNKGLRNELYLHRSCLPLDEAPIDDAVSLGLQPEFAMECEGMCGL